MLVVRMDDYSIYDDLKAQGDLGVVIHNLETKNNQLQKHVISLEEDIQKLCNKILEMKQTQENLSRNISELFKTAKNEIERKDRRIADLQAQLDDIVFKRNVALPHKRNRDESFEENQMKKPKCEIPLNREDRGNLTANSGVDHQQPKIVESVNLGKKDEQASSRYHETSNIRDTNTKNIRNEERKTVMDHNSSRRDKPRYDKDHNKRSNSRDRGHRGGVHNRRNNSDNDRYRRDNRGPASSRSGGPRDYGNRNRSPRRDRFDEGRDNRFDRREYNATTREVEVEPRFSPADSSNGTPEPSMDCQDVLNISREEGEITDNEPEVQRQVKTIRTRRKSAYEKKVDNEPEVQPQVKTLERRRKSTYERKVDNETETQPQVKSIGSRRKSAYERKDQKKIEVPKDDSLCDNTKSFDKTKSDQKQEELKEVTKSDFPCDKTKSFDVTKYIEKQKEMKESYRKKELVAKNIEKKEKLSEPKSLEAHSQKTLMVVVKNETEIPKTIVADTKDITNKSDKEKCEQKKRSSSKEKKSKSKKCSESETTEDNKNKKGKSDITILSQVVLNEGKVLKPPTVTSELPKLNPIKEVKLIDTYKKESGVPRNLSNELGVNSDKSKEKDTFKATNKYIERVTKKISSLFDTPIKEQAAVSKLPTNENYGLTHDGEIAFPLLEQKLDSQSTSSTDAKGSLTPVTEFQIFKTNLPNLEKSNSLSSASIQFQTPDSKNKVTTDGTNKTGDKSGGAPASSNQEKERPFCNIDNSMPVLEKQVYVNASNSDMCNLSMDLLDVPLGDYKAEDFPNLTVHYESRDMPNIISPVVEKVTKKEENREVSSGTLHDIREIIQSCVPNTSSEPVTLNPPADTSSNLNNSQETSKPNIVSTNLTPSPNIGDARKKRKRCVLRWAE